MAVQTLLGAVSPEALGTVLIHEHLNPGTCWLRQVRKGVPANDPGAILAAELRELKAHGVDTVVDVSSEGTGVRDVDLLCRASDASGVHIVVSTGFYKEPLLPPWVLDAEIDQLAEYMINEITHGIGGGKIKAGIIGEVGTSKDRITASEERVLRAAARAQRATGVPVSTHCTLATMGPEQVALFISEGVDPRQLVIGHCDLSPDPAYVEAVIKTGAFVGIDTIGKEHFFYVRPETRGKGQYAFEIENYLVPDARRAALVKRLVEAGGQEQLLFSSDIGQDRWVYENMETFGRWGYSYVMERFCPDLCRLGISGAVIQQILVANPARLFSPA